jgi:hypothetical protein
MRSTDATGERIWKEPTSTGRIWKELTSCWRIRKTRLIDAHLEGAFLMNAHLEGANLEDATGFGQAQLNRASGIAETRLPEGLARP